jgi:hypothetical protein
VTPEEGPICRMVLRGDKAAAIDPPMVADIEELAQGDSRKIDVYAAQDI